MNLEDKLEGLVIFLSQLTSEDKIKWRPYTSTFTLPGTQEFVGKIYITTYKDQSFVLYQYRERHYFDEESFTWSPGIKLEMFDVPDNTVKFTLPIGQAVHDLYDEVIAKASGIEDFIDKNVPESIMKEITKNIKW